mmetsp:Transcript_36284/g.41382  ORF Transcript_36284/g.41382 Transcript_36284/m.41382 type:complete len:353 (-) Transcript_36284:10-1068(-)
MLASLSVLLLLLHTFVVATRSNNNLRKQEPKKYHRLLMDSISFQNNDDDNYPFLDDNDAVVEEIMLDEYKNNPFQEDTYVEEIDSSKFSSENNNVEVRGYKGNPNEEEEEVDFFTLDDDDDYNFFQSYEENQNNVEVRDYDGNPNEKEDEIEFFTLDEEEDDDYEDDEETQLLVKKKKKSKKKLKARKRPSKHCMLTFFHGFELISSIPLLVLLAIQIFPIVMVPIQTLGYLQTTIRIYESLFVLILILVEWRVPFLRENYLLQTFFTRGFLHTFAAVLAMEEAFFDTKEIDNAYNTIHLEWAPTLGRKIALWSVFAIGCLYMIFGIFCLQILRNTLDTQHKEKMEEYEEGR